MKKYTHPIKKITHIQFKNGSSFRKSWVYFRSFIQDGGSFFSITKLKTNNLEIKANNSSIDQKNKIIHKKDEVDLINEINKIKLYFK